MDGLSPSSVVAVYCAAATVGTEVRETGLPDAEALDGERTGGCSLAQAVMASASAPQLTHATLATLRHRNRVNCIGSSPDGKLVAN
jgi:hypothetical protein